jgi:uncharacterized protein involved in outer membrane biogenesis
MPGARRVARTLLVLAAAALLALLILLLVLFNLDWNRAKPWLNARTSLALGRPFIIAGDLSLRWQPSSASSAAYNAGWRGIIPWPQWVAQDIHIGNPAPPATAPAGRKMANSGTAINEMANGEMASVKKITFALNPFDLLDQTITIPLLQFEAPLVHLQRDALGQNNWTFKEQDRPSAWKLQLQRVVLAKGNIHLTDAIQHADLSVEIDSIDQAPDPHAPAPHAPAYGVRWQMHGSYHNEPLSGDGKAGAILSLQHQIIPYPVMASLRMGKTVLALEGTLTKPTDLAALDMRLQVSGVSMAHLYALTGIVLPETPPFATEGHLTGTMNGHDGHWRYQQFSGKVGSSDIGGTLAYQTRPVRGLLSGAVVSHTLHFDDLAALIGADSNANKQKRGAQALQPANKVLPVEPFKTERWTSVDVELQYQAETIIRKQALPINKLSTRLRLQDGVLRLMPLDFDVAGGSLHADITLDGSGNADKAAGKNAGKNADKNADKNAIKASMTLSARHLKLKQLFPTLEPLRASVGEINGDAALAAFGNSVGSLLGAANGEVKTLINQGSVSKLLLEEMGLNVGNVILTRLIGDKPVKLNCMATDFSVTNGLMQTRSFVIDTDDALLTVEGKIDLTQEQLGLTIRPDSKGLRIFSLRAPIYVSGSFAHPTASVDKGVVAMRAGGALALSALTPFAALIPLITTGPGASTECAKLLADARTKPVAASPQPRR